MILLKKLLLNIQSIFVLFIIVIRTQMILFNCLSEFICFALKLSVKDMSSEMLKQMKDFRKLNTEHAISGLQKVCFNV